MGYVPGSEKVKVGCALAGAVAGSNAACGLEGCGAPGNQGPELDGSVKTFELVKSHAKVSGSLSGSKLPVALKVTGLLTLARYGPPALILGQCGGGLTMMLHETTVAC